MIKRNSIGYNYDKEKNKNKVRIEKEEKLINIKRRTISKNLHQIPFLKEEVGDFMLGLGIYFCQLYLGFNMDQICFALKMYKFSTIEEAVNVMMKDPDSKLYIHKFVPEGGLCQICGDKYNEHNSELEQRRNSEDEIVLDVTHRPIKIEIPESEKLSNLSFSRNEVKNRITNINLIKIDFPQQTLDDFDDPNICRICFSNKLNCSLKVSLECKHEFCMACVTNYLKTKINYGDIMTIKCLYGGCPKVFTNEEVKSFVDEQLWNKYKKFLLQKLKLNQTDLLFMNCPSPDCEEVVEIDPLEKEIFVECQQSHKFCSKCKEIGWHKKGKCVKYDNLLLHQILKNDSENVNFKQCPNCKIIIEKNNGCNHMKCLNCDYEFCWLCRKEYENSHYALYNFTGCPGMKYGGGPKKKSWWHNPCLKILMMILSVLIGLVVIVLILAFFLFLGCPYEFINCYLDKRFENKDEEDDNPVDEDESDEKNKIEIKKDELTAGKICICILLGLLGIACQPFYLIFYLLYTVMEAYRRFGCWVLFI